MKAMIFRNGVVELGEVPSHPLNEGWARLRVRSVGLCGTDVAKYTAAHFPRGHTTILGHEAVAEVCAINGTSGSIAPGDTVAVMPLLPCGTCSLCTQEHTNLCVSGRAIGRTEQGAFAEYVDAPLANLAKVSANQADLYILLDPLAVCVHASSFIAESSNSRKCLIIGDGTIACLQAWLQRQQGDDVWMLGKHDAHLTFMKQYGVRSFVAEEDSIDLFDVVFEAVGRAQPETLRAALEYVAPRGSVIVLGVFEQGYIHPMEVRKAFIKEVSLCGTNAYTYDEFVSACNLIAQHRELASFITHWFPVSAIEAAIEKTRNKEGLVLKIGLRNDLSLKSEKE